MTPTKKSTQRQRLEAVFPDAALSTVPRGGRSLTYIPVSEVKQRLNDVLGETGWSWRLDYPVAPDPNQPEWIVAQGTLTADIDGVPNVSAGVGAAMIKRTTKTKEIVDLGDDYKAADSYAMKKAAQSFGVGLYLSRTADAIRDERERQAHRDPLEEGLESAEYADTMCTHLRDMVRGLPDADRQKVRDETDRMGIVWPPTYEQFMHLVEFVADLLPSRPCEACGTVECVCPDDDETPVAEPDPQPPTEVDSTPQNDADAVSVDDGTDDGMVLSLDLGTDDDPAPEDATPDAGDTDAVDLVLVTDDDDAPTWNGTGLYDPADDDAAQPANAAVVEQVREMLPTLTAEGKAAFKEYRIGRGWDGVKAEDLNVGEILDLVEFLAELPTS